MINPFSFVFYAIQQIAMFRHGLGRPGCRATAAGGTAAGGTAGDAHVVGP